MYEDTAFELSTKLLSTEETIITYIEPSLLAPQPQGAPRPPRFMTRGVYHLMPLSR